MNILVTGAKGMVGTALVNNLKNIRDGKNRTRPLSIEEIYEYDLDSTPEELEGVLPKGRLCVQPCRCEPSGKIRRISKKAISALPLCC